MFDAYNQFKNTVPGEALLLIASFVGATWHAIRNRQVPVVEGLLGALSGFMGGLFFTLIPGFIFHYTLKDIWFFGAPIAYLTNYLLGGMDTVGKQIQDSPLKVFTSFFSAMTDEILAKIDKFKSPKP